MEQLYFSREKFLKDHTANIEDYARHESTRVWVDQCDGKKVYKDGTANICWILWDDIPMKVYISERWCEVEEK